MKTKAIFQKTAVILAMLVFVVFAFNACSSDDSGDDPDPIPGPTSYVLPAGDFPSVSIASEGAIVKIGEPILSETKKHVGDFSPMVKSIKGMDWHGLVKRDPDGLFGSNNATWNLSGEHFSNGLPSQTLSWNWWTLGILTLTHNATFQGEDLVWDGAKRFLIKDNGQWNAAEFSHYQQWSNWSPHVTHGTTYFKQVADHPEVYISMERDYIIEDGNNVTKTEGDYSITTITSSGLEQTNTTTMGASLSVDTSINYDALEASLSATIYGVNTSQINFDPFKTVTAEKPYIIPAGEKWRIITLTAVEKYFFSDSNGNPWQSNSLDIEPLGTIPYNVSTNNILIKYKDGEIISYDIVDGGIDSLH